MQSAEPKSKELRYKTWQMGMPEPGELYSAWVTAQEIGPTLGDGSALNWQEVKAWSDMTGNDITPDYAALVVRLSRTFVNWMRKGCNDGCRAPIYKFTSGWRSVDG